MRMKTFAKAVALFLVMALMMVMTISAAVTDVEVSYDSSDDSVVISVAHPDGAAAEGKLVNVVVTDGTTDVYWNDAQVDENGLVEFTFTMDPGANASGTYDVNLGGEKLAYEAAADSYTFVNEANAATFIRDNINLLDAAALQNYLETNNGGINFDVNCASGSDYYAAPNKSGVNGIIDTIDKYYGADANGEYQAAYYEFLAAFNQAVTIDLLNEGLATDVVAKYASVFGFDAGRNSWYSKLTPAQLPNVENALFGLGLGLDEGNKVLEAFDKAVALALYNDLDQSTKGKLVEYLSYTYAKLDLAGDRFTDVNLDSYNDLASRGDGTYANMVRDNMANASFESLTDVEEKFTAFLGEAWAAYNSAIDDGPSSAPSPGPGPSTTIVVTPPAPVVELFNDLGSVEWAKEAINALAKDGIVNGVAEGKFAPNDVLTREQFVKILVGALDIKASGNTPFTDVVASEYYANFVAIAYNSGIVNGTSATEFGVGQSLTREQLCTMVYRAIKALGINLKMVNNAANFADSAEISDWAKEAVDYLYKAGVVNGVGGNAFDPQGTTTRAMGAKVIYGVLEGGVK